MKKIICKKDYFWKDEKLLTEGNFYYLSGENEHSVWIITDTAWVLRLDKVNERWL